MKKLLLPLLILCLAFVAKAQSVDTIAVYSPSMDKNISSLVILPAAYDGSREFPVLYLLHGYGGNHETWLNIKPELPELASLHEMIIVCPDGARSWYWDSPVDSTLRYETFVASELVSDIDARYKTVGSPKGRAVTGLSMGGQGGLWLGFRHQDVFGACGSTSGGVDIRPFPDSWDMKKSLGEYSEHPENWESHTIASLLPGVKSGMPIIIDCGTSDFFYPVNEKLHSELLYRNIRHEYISRPGVHRNTYWAISIEPQLLFFANFFKGKPVYQQ
ncbi:MAG: esterase family protein [Muribaculaceae bacterium]|nr:esterase family protein [Muribaculaceae bacterium]